MSNCQNRQPGTSRRDFLKTSSLAVGGAMAGSLAIGRSAHAAGDEVLKVGLIGCGGRGTGAAVQALSADENAKLTALADVFPDQVARCIEETGFGFMFAPAHHAAMKHVVPVRKELAVRIWRRHVTVGDITAENAQAALAEADCSGEEADAIYKLSALATFEDRFVVPPFQREMAIEMLEDPHEHRVGLSLAEGPDPGDPDRLGALGPKVLLDSLGGGSARSSAATSSDDSAESDGNKRRRSRRRGRRRGGRDEAGEEASSDESAEASEAADTSESSDSDAPKIEAESESTPEPSEDTEKKTAEPAPEAEAEAEQL